MLPRTPTFRLNGRRAVVTGAGRGIGVALSAALAEAGAEVTLLARSAADIERVAAEIVTSGGAAQVKVLDVLDLPRVREFFADAPVFDVLVNNAGTNRPMPM
jgi:NAD(P)-dependent dehydrogenase (short-subunit alcohol dehydrogenase family)